MRLYRTGAIADFLFIDTRPENNPVRQNAFRVSESQTTTAGVIFISKAARYGTAPHGISFRLFRYVQPARTDVDRDKWYVVSIFPVAENFSIREQLASVFGGRKELIMEVFQSPYCGDTFLQNKNLFFSSKF